MGPAFLLCTVSWIRLRQFGQLANKRKPESGWCDIINQSIHSVLITSFPGRWKYGRPSQQILCHSASAAAPSGHHPGPGHHGPGAAHPVLQVHPLQAHQNHLLPRWHLWGPVQPGDAGDYLLHLFFIPKFVSTFWHVLKCRSKFSPVNLFNVLGLHAGPSARAASHPWGLHQTREGLPAWYHLCGSAEETPHETVLHGQKREGQYRVIRGEREGNLYDS